MMIRPIVEEAFKVDELVEQFSVIDTEDGLLAKGTVEEVNEKYDDAHIVGEARHRLTLVQDQINHINHDCEDLRIYERDAHQLRRFITKWGRA